MPLSKRCVESSSRVQSLTFASQKQKGVHQQDGAIMAYKEKYGFRWILDPCCWAAYRILLVCVALAAVSPCESWISY